MKKVFLAALLTTLIVFLSFQDALAKDKKDVFSMSGLILYQEDPVMRDRLASNISLLADYSLILEARAKEVFKNADHQDGVSGVIIVTIKPGNKSRMWLALENDTLPETLKQNVLQELSSVKTIPVKKGPIMIGLRFDAWGGGKPLEESHPIPQEWKDVIKDNNPVIIPDTPLAVLWPDEQIVADEFIGIWEGDLEVIDGQGGGIPPAIKYKFEFTDKLASVSMWTAEEGWLHFKIQPEISYQTKSHVFMHGVTDTGEVIELFSINLVRLDKDNIQAYVSRIINDYAYSREKSRIPNTYYAKGNVARK